MAIVWERLGAYHHARLERAAQHFDLTAVEIYARDGTYDWAPETHRDGYRVVTLADTLGISARALRARLYSSLEAANPAVIAVPGWAAPYALWAIDWAVRHGRRVVLMSDSNSFDAPRQALRERLKQAVLAHSAAFFVAGSTARDYLLNLGVSPGRIALGYDVVDNDHFACAHGGQQRKRSGFLCVSRFIARKNIEGLVVAYARFRARMDGASNDWPLTLVGDGPERERLEAIAAAQGIAGTIRFAGFRGYDELPAYYHDAAAFVLPSRVEQWGLVVNEAMAAGLPVLVSSSAGAAADLVIPGDNGQLFTPDDTDALVEGLIGIARDPVTAAWMGRRSREIIADWGLDRFASGLVKAVGLAESASMVRPGWIDRAAFTAMMARSLSTQAGV